uniref:Uncharacterized protein n=1 Tax=Anguilla anguilla TaxID=7936 RepID=A0A0E9U599_ANGAN
MTKELYIGGKQRGGVICPARKIKTIQKALKMNCTFSYFKMGL